MTDNALLTQTKELVKSERSVLKRILLNLCEIEKRKLYLTRGYSSMFVYCTRALGYSESAAQRRIDAMRAIRDVPLIATKIEQGKLTLSSIALAQKTMRQAQKLKSESLPKHKKIEVFESIEGKSSKESEKVLVKEFPQTLEALRPDRARALTETQTEIKFIAEQTLLQKLEIIKHKLSHKNVAPSYNELFQMMADQILAKPKQNRTRKTKRTLSYKVNFDSTNPEIINPDATRSSNSCRNQGRPIGLQHNKSSQRKAPSQRRTKSRYISIEARRAVYKRDRSECQYIDPLSKRKCRSNHLIQIDHHFPVSLGGSSELANLQLLCAAHNRLKGTKIQED